MKKLLILFVMLPLIVQVKNSQANNLRLTGSVKVTSVEGNIATLEFPLKWDNAWRDSYNRDAVWILLRYKVAGGSWQPLNPEASGHSLVANDGKSYTCLPGTTDGKTTGLFILLNELATCNPSLSCRLKWTLPAGLTKASFENNDAFLLAQGIEMVYIPYGAFQVGDTSAEGAFTPVIMDSEESRTINPANAEAIALPADYPKGYRGFHVMKYEVSQEQYVSFLNTLTLSQQQELIRNHASLKPGDYVFGDPKHPSHRNGIILVQKPEGAPMIFDNNLTPGLANTTKQHEPLYPGVNCLGVALPQVYSRLIPGLPHHYPGIAMG